MVNAAPLFKAHSLEAQAQSLANFLPNGSLYSGKNVQTSVFRSLLRGLAHCLKDAESLLITFDDELDISQTTAFLESWEKTLGIPDECFDTNVSIAVRRQQVLIKLAALGVQTVDDFKNLALIYGIEIEIDGGIIHGSFPFTFPIIFFDTVKEARFTMVVFYEVAQAYTFPYTYPLIFGGLEIPVLECLFRKLVPANVDVQFWQVDEVDVFGGSGFDSGFDSGFGG